MADEKVSGLVREVTSVRVEKRRERERERGEDRRGEKRREEKRERRYRDTVHVTRAIERREKL